MFALYCFIIFHSIRLQTHYKSDFRNSLRELLVVTKPLLLFKYVAHERDVLIEDYSNNLFNQLK